jgi:hypothetical protein
MIVNNAGSTPSNPFNLAGSPAAAATSASFAQQLSTALAESLQRLGMGAGEVNITIRNSVNSANPQILISYDGAVKATPASGGTTAATTAAQTLAPDQDPRDEMAQGGGKVTASGAPLIEMNASPARNQYDYTGVAALNPYFTTPSNPLRDGLVTGFDKWFTQPFILGGKSGPMPANKLYYSTEEGAQEALRLVKQYVPEAKITHSTWGNGIFMANIPMYQIELPNGERLSAGALLDSYYYGGRGVTAASDNNLKAGLAALTSAKSSEQA